MMLEIKEKYLNNGLKIVMCKKQGMPVIIVNSAFHAGSKNDPPDKTGLSHFIEHLMFTGTANISGGDFDGILSANGGESNAFTANDYTSYYLTLPSSGLELGLWLDSDKFTGFTADEESLRIQKEVVLEEKLQVHDNSPYGTVEEESSKRLFPSNGYRWNIVGSAGHINSFTHEDVNKYYHEFYKPSNAILTIAGDIDYDVTEKLINKYYDDIPGRSGDGSGNGSGDVSGNGSGDVSGNGSGDTGGKKLLRNAGEKKRNNPDTHFIEAGEEVIFDNISLPARFIFYRIPESGSKEYYALKVLSSVLSAGESSRLQRRLIHDRNYANEIYSYVSGMELGSFLSISCFCNEDTATEEAGKEIDNIIDDILNGGLKDTEIEKAKNKIKTNYIIKLQSILQAADKLTYFGLIRGRASLVNEEIEKYDAINKSDILNTAKEYLKKNNRVVLNYLPAKVKEQ